MKIKQIKAHEILASGGFPTVQVIVELENGTTGEASVPYGASAGSHEAKVITDNDPKRWLGQGVKIAIENIRTKITPALLGIDAQNPRNIDQIMIALDGTSNKSNLGGNAILAVSLACARAMANSLHLSLYKFLIDAYDLPTDLSHLPHPMVVAIEGGKHAHNTTDMQEFCFLGTGQTSVEESIRACLEAYHSLKDILKNKGLSTNVGNEGAFAPSNIESNEAPLQLMMQAIEQSGYQAGNDISLALDPASSEFYDHGFYKLSLEKVGLSSTEMISYFKNWLEKYPIASLEDPLHEDDWAFWPQMKQITDRLNVKLVGDDLTVTNKDRLQKAIDLNAISSILIKLNQIGTLTETIDCCMLAKQHGLTTITSHRGGGETNDTAMVDVAVAVGSSYIKVGPTRGERVAKYNRLMEIERELS